MLRPVQNPDEIIAEDFFDEPERWQEYRLDKSELLKLIHWRVEKEMTHLTYTRMQFTAQRKRMVSCENSCRYTGGTSTIFS